MFSPILGGKRRRLIAPAIGVAATALVLAATGAGTANAATTVHTVAASSKTLTVAMPLAPTSLDPALQNVDPTNGFYIQLAYDPLIRLGDDDKSIPDLATSWKYTNSDATAFELKLRKGVKFSDGTTMTADDVVKSIQYVIASGVNGGTWLGKDTTVTSPSALTVDITTSSSNSVLPFLLSQRTYLGSVISAKGMSDTTQLKSATYGAGPYMLDTANTTPNDTYTYVKNPNYWNPSKQHWNKVVLKVVGSTSAALQAVENGDADMFRGDVTTATAAKAAGLSTKSASLGLYGVGYLDRAGEISKPLANKKVREALSYAIDRKSITQAVWGDLGTAGNDLTLKGFAGFTKSVSNSYSYNVAKAKKLLKQAGYAKGFTFDMQTTNAGGADIPAQAIVQDWAKIGVTAKLTVYSDNTQLINDTLAKKYAVGIYYYGAQQPYLQAKSFFNGGVNQYNPWNSQDTKINNWLSQAAASSSTADQQKLYAKVMQRAMVTNAWFSNVAYTPSITIYKAKGLTGMDFGSLLGSPDIAWNVKSN